MKMNNSALTKDLEKQLNKVKQASLLIGIPSYNCASTINYVIYQSALGLINYFQKFSHAILVSDGGSSDGTLNAAKAFKLPRKINLILGRYEGASGKGSAVKAIMEASIKLNSDSVIVLDSDLRSIKPEWIKVLFSSIINESVDLAAPLYIRDKFDGTITNHLCYPFTKGVYECDVRQPIGGDFAFSRRLIEDLLQNPLWKSVFTKRFGIDIFITHSAIAKGYKIYEVFLGSKLHEAKDPSVHLKNMFIQVAGSMLDCMNQYRDFWLKTRRLSKPPLIKELFSFPQPEDLALSFKTQKMIFKKEIKENFLILKKLLEEKLLKNLLKLNLRDEDWAKIAYSLAVNYLKGKLDLLNVLKAFYSAWLGKVTFFIKETCNLSNEEAEAKIREEAETFRKLKPYLIKVYNEMV
jgi:glycosyltransferase involved in cell wall biosynthesis